MTLARAMAAEKGRGEEVSIFNNTPPDANFLSNSTQAIVLRAELAAPPLHLLFGNNLTNDLPPQRHPQPPLARDKTEYLRMLAWGMRDRGWRKITEIAVEGET